MKKRIERSLKKVRNEYGDRIHKDGSSIKRNAHRECSPKCNFYRRLMEAKPGQSHFCLGFNEFLAVNYCGLPVQCSKCRRLEVKR